MKVFISWSGERSRRVAELLDTWIQCVIQAVDPWVSSQDIDRGALWFSEITNQLANTTHGIICLTKSNKEKPWILFEAGALAKGLSSSRVFTFLIDLNPEDVKDPLAQFNHTMPNREGLFKLIYSINNSLEANRLKESIIRHVLDTYWPQFEDQFQKIIEETPQETISEDRSKDDILFEVLNSIRSVEKRMRHIEFDKDMAKINMIDGNRNVTALPSLRAIKLRAKILSELQEMIRQGYSYEGISSGLKENYSAELVDELLKEQFGNVL